MRKLSVLASALFIGIAITSCHKEHSITPPVKPVETIIYTHIAHTDSTGLTEAKSRAAAGAAGTKIVIAGGSTVDIYDVVTNKWTTDHLSNPRVGLVGAGAGNKVVFAGGAGTGTYSSDKVDIYDVTTGKWTTALLSEARRNLTAVALGNKIFFAGGQNTPDDFSKTVDIYDVSTNIWSTAQLSVGRCRVAAAAAGSKVLFAGGAMPSPPPFVEQSTDIVDVYDMKTNTWTTTKLSAGPRDYFAGAGAGTKIVFAGGEEPNGQYYSVAEVYDTVTGLWTTSPYPNPTEGLAAVGIPNKIVFAGGFYDMDEKKEVSVYDITTNAWTTLFLTEPRSVLAGAGIKDKILFAGGIGDVGFDYGDINTVDIFTLTK